VFKPRTHGQKRVSTMRVKADRLDSLNLLLPPRFMDNETRQIAGGAQTAGGAG